MKKLLLLSLTILASALFAISCGSSSKSAADTAKDAYACIEKGDFVKFTEYIEGTDEWSSEDKQQIASYLELAFSSVIDFKIVSIKELQLLEDGNKAEIEITTSYNGSEETETGYMIKDDKGNWKFESDGML